MAENIEQLKKEVQDLKETVETLTDSLKSHRHNGSDSSDIREILRTNQNINITGAIITGKTLRTSGEETRVQMDTYGSYANELLFYYKDNLNGAIWSSAGPLLNIKNPQSGGAVTISTGDGLQATFILTYMMAKNIQPSSDSTYSLGSNTTRWLNIYSDNIYCANQTANKFVTGDLSFKNLFRIDEVKNGLRFWNKDNKQIAKLDQKGNFYIKGKVKKL